MGVDDLYKASSHSTILAGRANRAPNESSCMDKRHVTACVPWKCRNIFPCVSSTRRLKECPLEDWAPLLPEEGRAQAPTAHFSPLGATVSTSLTTSVCENNHGAQGRTHCIGLSDTGAAGSSYNLEIN